MKKYGFFVTGTDTSAGKTVVTAAFIDHLQQSGRRVVGLKPIASGFTRHNGMLQNEDVQALQAVNNTKIGPSLINRYAFEPAIAPHIAAEREGVSIDFDLISADVDKAFGHADTVIVEGVGGWLVPLCNEYGSAKGIHTLAERLQLPVILVVGMRLGCLNHALLSANAIAAAHVTFAGWVANFCDPDFAYARENVATLEQLMPVPKLFEVPYRESSDSKVNITKINPDWTAG